MILKRLLLSPSPLEGGASAAKVEIKTPPAEVLAQNFDASLEDAELFGDEATPASDASAASVANPSKGRGNQITKGEQGAEGQVKTQQGGEGGKGGEGEAEGSGDGEGQGEASAEGGEAARSRRTVGEEQNAGKPTNAPANKLGEQVRPPARDYTGFSEEEAKVLRQMSNPAFEFATKVLKQNKELAASSKNLYLQHPNAYVLDPEFQKLNEDTFYADAESKHWQEQLMLIKAGKPWKPLKGFTKEGTPVYGPEQQPSDLAEEEARSNMGYTAQLAQQTRGQLQMFQQQYGQRVAQDTQQIKAIQQQKFSWHADPKILDTVINVQGVGDRSIKQIKSDFMGLLPAYQHNHPLADVCADMFVALQLYAGEVRKAREGSQVQQVRQEEVTRAEPTSRERAKPAGSGKQIGNWAANFDELPPI